MSMVALKSQSSNSTANRPLWGAHKTKAKYQVSLHVSFFFKHEIPNVPG